MPDDLVSQLNLAQIRPGQGPPAGANEYPARGAGPSRKPISLSRAKIPGDGPGGVPKTSPGPSLLGQRDSLGDYRQGMATPDPGEFKPPRAAQRLAIDPHMESRLGEIAKPGGGYAPPPGEIPPLGGPPPEAPLTRLEELALKHGGSPAFEPPSTTPSFQTTPRAPGYVPPNTSNPAIAHQLAKDTMSLPATAPEPPTSLMNRIGNRVGATYNRIPAPIRDKVSAGGRMTGRLAGPVTALVDTVNANKENLGHTIASGLEGQWLPGEGGGVPEYNPSFMGIHFGGLADAIGHMAEGYDPFTGPPRPDTGPILRGPYQKSNSPATNAPMPGNVMDLFNAGRPGYNKYPGQPTDAEKVPEQTDHSISIPGLPRMFRGK